MKKNNIGIEKKLKTMEDKQINFSVKPVPGLDGLDSNKLNFLGSRLILVAPENSEIILPENPYMYSLYKELVGDILKTSENIIYSSKGYITEPNGIPYGYFENAFSNKDFLEKNYDKIFLIISLIF